LCCQKQDANLAIAAVRQPHDESPDHAAVNFSKLRATRDAHAMLAQPRWAGPCVPALGNSAATCSAHKVRIRAASKYKTAMDYRHLQKRKSMHARIVQELGIEIVSGRLKPGERLPAESALCEQYGVSRPVLREATRVLVAKGLVVSKPRVGST